MVHEHIREAATAANAVIIELIEHAVNSLLGEC